MSRYLDLTLHDTVRSVAWRFMSTSLGYMVPGDACATRAFEEPCGSPTNSRDFSAWVSPASCIRIGRLVADPLQIPDIVSGWEFTCRQEVVEMANSSTPI